MASEQAQSTLDQQLEDYETRPVPESVTRTWVDQTLVWAGITFCLAAWFVGGSLTAGFGFYDTLLVMIAGAVILVVMGALAGWIGATTRLSTAMNCRFAFGREGSKILGIVLSISCWGWFAFQAGLFGLTLQIALKQGFGWEVPVEILIFLGGIGMMTTAVVGYRAMSWLSRWAVPLMAILALWALIATLNAHPWSEISSKGPSGQPLPFMSGVAAVVGSYAVGATISADISRYSRRRSDSQLAALWGLGITFVPIFFLGSIFSFAWGDPNVVNVMTINLGLGLFAYITLILAQWTTNQSNLYSSALGLSAVIPWPKWRLSIAIGIVSTIIGTFQIYNVFLQFLILLSALIPPILGTLVADYYFFNSRLYKWENISKLKPVNWISVASWLTGSVVGVLLGVVNVAPDFSAVVPVPLAALLTAVVVQVVLTVALRGQRAEYPSALQPT